MNGKKIQPRSIGFTIVELLVVIVVIGILAAITIVSYTGISQKATIASFQADLDSASRLLKMDQVTGGQYPTMLNLANDSKGLTASNGANFIAYEVNNSVSPQTFCLTVNKGSLYYRITNDSAPTSGTCPSLYATGGTITEAGGYRIHTFNSSGTFTINSGISSVDVLVVGGGGGGGGRPYHGGGGGGGGVVYTSSYSVVSGSYSVVVGNGGSGYSATEATLKGQDSSFSTLVATGGGGGGGGQSVDGPGYNGGSGGGASVRNATGGTGIIGQGYAGGGGQLPPEYPNYGAGGGGGAGGVGLNGTTTTGGNGGPGITYSISGVSTYYAGGGGGSVYSNTTSGVGGIGGGGAGAYGVGGVNGTANTGSGGGGRDSRGAENKGSGNGGSGIVIVRYLLP